MAKILGIDISSHQKNVNFKKVIMDGIKFAILREGYRKTIDDYFIKNVKECQQNNIYIMTYHFIYTDGATPQENAQSTYNNLKKAGLDPANTWIAADLEYDTWKKNKEKCTRERCTKYTKQYLNELKRLGCNKLFIYANNDYYKNYYDWNQLSDYPLWLADYTGEPDQECVIQQYTSKGRVNGINGNVDMNYLFDQSMLSKNTTTAIKKEDSLITPAKVIAIAMGEVGYKEKRTNASLDDKTANAGTGNYTKYARDFDQKYPNWYNGKKNGFDWCDMFVDWCFLTAFGYNKALELLCQPQKSAGAGCTCSFRYYKNKGQSGRTPKVGAQIFFGNSESDLRHTGLVYKVDNSYVYTIEGNTSAQVAYRKYNRATTKLWYGYPNYDENSDLNLAEQSTTSDLSIGSTGSQVTKMQTMLIKLGYSCGDAGIDGSFGNDTLDALKKFQKDNNLTVDGLYGPKSKAKLTELYEAATAAKKSPTPASPQKSTEEIAKEVINGQWGNSADRKKRLEAAGYNYNTIQDKVNELVGGKKQTVTTNSQTIKIDSASSFNKKIAKIYKTTANLRLRTGASTLKTIITVIPKGAEVTCYGYHTNDWYYVKYQDYTGFCSKEYLK